MTLPPGTDPYGLLIAHAQAWAAKSKRALDAQLLGVALNLRDAQDRMPGTSWPDGSAESLMTVRWPGHGPAGVPDVDLLVDTLDSFWRFLRATGRMSSDSASPTELAKEARRAKAEMRERCGDPKAFSATKSLLGFGRELGYSLDSASSMADMQSQLDEVVAAWNNLSDEERFARSPGPPGAGSVISREFAEFVSPFGGVEDSASLAGVFGDGPGYGPEIYAAQERLVGQDPVAVAAQARESEFMQQLVRLRDWVGAAGQPMTASGYLKPSAAHEAIAALGLDDWWRGVLDAEPPSWRSAGEHEGLMRLVIAAESIGLVRQEKSRLRQGAVLATDEDWRVSAVAALVILNVATPVELGPSPIVGAMLGLLGGMFDTVDDVKQWWRENGPFAWDQIDVQNTELVRSLERASDEELDQTLARWRDTGVLRESAEGLEVTELGIEFLRIAMLQLEAENDFDPELDELEELDEMEPLELMVEALEALEHGDREDAQECVWLALRSEPADELTGPDAAITLFGDEIFSAIHDGAPRADRVMKTVETALRRNRRNRLVHDTMAFLVHEVASSNETQTPRALAQRIERTIPRVSQDALVFPPNPSERMQFEFMWTMLEVALAVHMAAFHDA